MNQFFILLLLFYVPASLASCLQAPGFSNEVLLRETLQFCPHHPPTEDDRIKLKHEFNELSEYFKNTNEDESEGAMASLYFNTLRKYTWAQNEKNEYSILAKEEVYTVINYVEWGYQSFNSALWTGSASMENVSDIRVLGHALSKIPAFTGTVFRGEIEPQVESDIQSIPTRIERLKIGEVFQFKSFMSTTVDRNAGNYMNNRVIVFEIESKRGRYIGPLSTRPEEEEVLFLPGTWFKVLEMKKVKFSYQNHPELNFQWKIKLQEL